ncbi:hypothetical protein GCM10007415_31330 [Parapedobacter pyrenivorans]|uniref:HTH cro/C1-type domain-containing protein n=1 Tax=Parapedobacter pyrenivorans TaxID=1305674 RepID=A0A917MCU7_9SPHI|nr:helix-turn-helix transcriptional regulator [Parapedobacter pyrenivorans]GGG94023.1 hypothetical protein GCM10007415_31330 [Parapedobacter pyrenivorans]
MEDVYNLPTLGERIRYIRKKKNYVQDGIALKAGITQKALSKIELNETNPSIYRIYRIAESLEVDVYMLIPKERWNATYTAYGIFGKLFIGLLKWARRGKDQRR